MTQIEAHLTAEMIAAQLLKDQDAEKVSFLRERAVELVEFFDEYLRVLESAA
jgi:hypothetical protein